MTHSSAGVQVYLLVVAVVTFYLGFEKSRSKYPKRANEMYYLSLLHSCLAIWLAL
jgi:hypothetical protein